MIVYRTQAVFGVFCSGLGPRLLTNLPDGNKNNNDNDHNNDIDNKNNENENKTQKQQYVAVEAEAAVAVADSCVFAYKSKELHSFLLLL